jgi:integrase/recombinase XerD
MGRKKKEIRLKEPVRIREKKIAGGNISLYLDIYQNGLRKKESLKLYIVPEVNAATKLQNANTRKLAEQIKAQRIIDIQKEGLVDWNRVKKTRMTLRQWLEQYASENGELSASSARAKRNMLARVNEYLIYIGKPDLTLKEVDKDFCKGFITFLKSCTFNCGKKTLSQTTCRIFVNRFGSALAKAVREGLIEHNPFLLLEAKEKPQKRVAEREFLTIEELKKVMATPCRYEIVKQAFLFSCFTGLRYSDMLSLKWSEIHKAADGVTEYIDHTQVKTKDRVTIPLSEETKKWMPKQKKGEDTVFHELKITSTTVEVVLAEWMEAAGINKHITYHCSRHTAATLLLTLGASIYVVSKILGHKSIKMTEVYAKIVDKTKVETVNLVNGMFNQTKTAGL